MFVTFIWKKFFNGIFFLVKFCKEHFIHPFHISCFVELQGKKFLAFNFNNFGVIYMLTRGNPRFSDTTLDVGATDIMITMVYKVAFGSGGGRDLGLASALSILIFIIVTIVAVASFRRTKALEDLN